jgi:hypothetical protein
MNRQIPVNLSCESDYPGEKDLVVFSIRFPDLTAHRKHIECEIEEPHKIDNCGLWKNINDS